MASSLSYIVNNFPERIHRTKCKYKHDDKNVKHAELNIIIKCTYCDYFLEYTNFIDDLIERKFYAVTKVINKSF